MTVDMGFPPVEWPDHSSTVNDARQVSLQIDAERRRWMRG
jgi:hypothetical protein